MDTQTETVLLGCTTTSNDKAKLLKVSQDSGWFDFLKFIHSPNMKCNLLLVGIVLTLDEMVSSPSLVLPGPEVSLEWFCLVPVRSS